MGSLTHPFSSMSSHWESHPWGPCHNVHPEPTNLCIQHISVCGSRHRHRPRVWREGGCAQHRLWRLWRRLRVLDYCSLIGLVVRGVAVSLPVSVSGRRGMSVDLVSHT